MSNRPLNTLFMLSSVDGKISTGKGDERDTDKDYKKIGEIREGVKQYYNLEQETDLHTLNSGKVMAKIGMNSNNPPINNKSLSFIIIDNNHLTKNGVENLCNGLKTLYLVTNNPLHPAFDSDLSNLVIFDYSKRGEIDLEDIFIRLKQKYSVEKVTIQSGGTLNAIFMRAGLIDRISIVIAPVLVGGSETPSILDGASLVSEDDLKHIRSMQLLEVNKLDNSFLHLVYSVNN